MDRPVFVSYSRKDMDFATMLVAALESEGFTVWWDQHIRGGRKWNDELEHRLNQAGCIIVIWSEHSAASDWVLAEATVGLDSRKLVPVFIDDCTLPSEQAELQMIDLAIWRGGTGYSNFRELVGLLHNEVNLTNKLDDLAVIIDDYEQFFKGDSLAELIELAEDSDLDAMNNLAKGFLFGYGDLQKDENEAIEWFKIAVEGGHTEAAHHLGDCCHQRDDFDTAKRWYEQAAAAGCGISAYQLGRMYAYGEGVRQNPKLALRWLSRAEELGEGDANQNYKKLMG